ncbi:MAG: hypothetical protein J0L84_03325, partial [Verrucomicrobia bacterium]|nr:hypothetical protein [Verrucomicrobiota bacterium]
MISLTAATREIVALDAAKLRKSCSGLQCCVQQQLREARNELAAVQASAAAGHAAVQQQEQQAAEQLDALR